MAIPKLFALHANAIRHLLSKFEDSLEKICKSYQEYCRLLIDPVEIENATIIFKSQEFR